MEKKPKLSPLTKEQERALKILLESAKDNKDCIGYGNALSVDSRIEKDLGEFNSKKEPSLDSRLFIPSPEKDKKQISENKYLLYLNNDLKIIRNKTPLENYTTKYEEKNIEYSLFTKSNFSKHIIQNYMNIGASRLTNLGLNVTAAADLEVNADTLPTFCEPIAHYIHDIQPDYIVACDRGARLFALAVFRLYNKLYGRLPTVDGTLRFRRISKTNSQEATEAHLQPLVEEMLRHRKRPKVLVLDDWVAGGMTKAMVWAAFDHLSGGRVRIKYGVLLGQKAEVSGQVGLTSFGTATDWHDNSNILGVSYGSSGTSQAMVPTVVRSRSARTYRERLLRNIKGIDAGMLIARSVGRREKILESDDIYSSVAGKLLKEESEYASCGSTI